MAGMAESAVAAMVERARRAWRAWGRLLASDPTVQAKAAELSALAAENQRAFAQAGVYEICAACAAEDSGSCCQEGIERHFHWQHLLVNLLLGGELPPTRLVPGQCFFNGPRGCLLRAKFSICLNHFCPRLRRALGEEPCEELVRRASREIWAGYELENAMRAALRRRGWDWESAAGP